MHYLSDLLTTAARERGVTHLLVEPGPTLARAFFEAGLVDRVWQIRSPKRVDDASAPAAAGIPGDFLRSGQLDLDGDVLSEFLNPASTVFFAAERSADLVLAEHAIGAPKR
jgi:riboflavin biosynthesis pyrimidine reductase